MTETTQRGNVVTTKRYRDGWGATYHAVRVNGTLIGYVQRTGGRVHGWGARPRWERSPRGGRYLTPLVAGTMSGMVETLVDEATADWLYHEKAHREGTR